jgi:sugar-specific transcriptional regulator TrmB
MTTNDPEQALAALGFTDTEARVYCELLRAGPATGYRLSQAIGKAAANTYQALSALSQKGAVLVDDGDARAFRAVAPAELLAALERGFDQRRTEAEAALKRLHVPAGDDRIYQLKTPDQVYERARAMIEGARQIILFDAFPAPLARLTPALDQAAASGVTVAGLAYGQAPAAGFSAFTSHGADFVAERWPGQQLSLVVDALQHLVVLLSDDGERVLHGVWSDSVYLACLKHSGLASEIRVSERGGAETDPLARLSLLRSYPPGLKALVGPQQPEETRGDAA